MAATTSAEPLFLVADVGGTNMRVGLARGPDLQTASIRRFRNEEHAGIESVLSAYSEAEGGVDCTMASVAIAGPVREGRGTLTNLNWSIDEPGLARVAGTDRAVVLNDLQAQGHALGRIAQENLREIIAAPPAAEDAAKLVIGVGTGFNVAPVHDIGPIRLVAPAEAGHGNLPIRNEEELSLCRFVETAHGFPAVEDVLSGRGLERVYAWLGHEADAPREARAVEIMAGCESGNDGRAIEAVRMFVRLLGRVAGNNALDHLPFGGVFLAGGVARAMAPHLQPMGFVEAFRDKGRFAGFMHAFAVHVIEDDFAALAGSAAHLARISAS